MQPTLFKGHNKMRIFQEEIFGPVLAVPTFKDEAAALAIANDTLYGLGAGVWSRNGNVAYRMGRAIRSCPIKRKNSARSTSLARTRLTSVRTLKQLLMCHRMLRRLREARRLDQLLFLNKMPMHFGDQCFGHFCQHSAGGA